jgi:outer membrane protein OmpA-like peptidoglycan-associated protein
MFQHAFSYFIAFLLLFNYQIAEAQQTSKAKTKEKLYEKTGENKNVKVRNAANINTEGDEFSPAFYKDGIVFASSRGKVGSKTSASTTTDLYYAGFDPNLEPRRSSRFSLEMNSRRNEGAAVFSRDWEYMYFSQNNIVDGVERPGRDKVLHLKIFEARRGRIDWMNKRELPFNSDQYSCMHPSLSADGKTIYFASDMKTPEAQGGFDIYKSVLKDGMWSSAINLGPTVNTPKNDVFPFIYPSGDLYFASSGHNGFGGYDIFRINLEQTKKEGLINLGEPFNSAGDDFALILTDDGTRGYFTSNRPGGRGRDDIYSFTVETAMPGMERIEPVRKAIMVTDQSGKPIQGAEIRVLALGEGQIASASKDLYRTRLEKVDKNSNELRITLVKLGAEELGQPDAFTNTDGETLIDFKPYTEYLIWANNDNWAAQVNYRIKANETDDKIVIKLEEPNAKVLAGKLLNPSGHKISNAKLRFTNTENWTQDNGTSDSEGNFAIALPKGSYYVRVQKDGFKPDYLDVEFDPETSTFREFRLAHESKPANGLNITEHIKPGLVFTIDKIEYEFNSDRLDRKAQLNLMQVVDLMRENPTMEIDIASHTDAQGSDKSNLALSQRRAEVVKEFIIESSKRTVVPSRIKATGRGETAIINHCKEGITCADADHAVNRRTEIVVRKL